jgi:hypothetical protein
LGLHKPGARPTYWLTRFVILRLLGIIYGIAFLVAINQIVPLIGSNGLLPAASYLERIGNKTGIIDSFLRLPRMNK